MNQGKLKIMEEKSKKKVIKRGWCRFRQVTQKLVRRERLLKSKVTEFREANAASPLWFHLVMGSVHCK